MHLFSHNSPQFTQIHQSKLQQNLKPSSMASATNTILSSNFFGSRILLSTPTPKTHKPSRTKFIIPQSILNRKPNSSTFSQSNLLTAPKPQSSDLPEGSQWRYSEFLNAVKKGKVERVRFSKDGGVLQLTATDGRRASVVVPNDPDLIDILAMNGVDISVSEGEATNGLIGFIGNLLFPLLAFGGLFFLFRVRDLFEKAKSKAPCIVFIDEIDAVGRQRGAGLGGGNDEREQTINQLLTEMDGFSGNSGVIVLAATNRPDVLDSALLRPGRFDRQVTVDRPDVAGRVRILQVHSRGKALAKDVDFDKIARRTPGFTGADLQNLMNEAAILAARRELKEISKDEIADALERIIAGPEKKNAVVSEEKKKLVAYHEAGHALVGALMPEYDPVAKISIIPRGQAGGLTFFAPSEERLESGLYSRSYLENQMAVALGGRVAEEVIFGKENVTTGASNDFMQVSRVARQMVERFGFSKKIGQVAIGGGGGNPFLGQQMSSQKDYSMATADIVDAEVRELVERAYERATSIITTHIDILHKLSQLLMEKETVDGEEFMSLFIDGKAELYIS
ncbi:ATP-dependent zinc metalloprotease FTSH [Helianthus annuus]|nr:ATP-dependent zinc metalloprotease FTSH [Helianthus annuus]KAJ0484171.1 ATP-dependent zinc metalloprotease FTSH [Helianthus annuus]KAJ0658476.1 ATP-dependent zinc metalloprotease FTSH [Helianthus annuus]